MTSLLAVFLYALQYSHVDKPVRKKQTEELAFHCLELVLTLGCSLHFLGSALTLCLLVNLLHHSVVYGSEVVGTDIVGIVVALLKRDLPEIV